MGEGNFWIYLLVMAVVTYLIRVLPFAAFRKKVGNKRVRAFLAYIPYAVLGAMTFPAVFYATGKMPAAVAGVAAALIAAYRGKGLFFVAACASLAALIVGWLLPG